MKFYNLPIVAVLASMAMAAMSTYSVEAQAASKRLVASAFCHPQSVTVDVIGGATVDRVRRIGPQLRNDWGQNTIICGYPSDGSLTHNNVDLIKVRGYRGTFGDVFASSVRACVGTFGGGERCGYSTFFDNGSGNFTVDINDISKWANAHWYPYLKFTLQPGDRLYGIVVTD